MREHGANRHIRSDRVGAILIVFTCGLGLSTAPGIRGSRYSRGIKCWREGSAGVSSAGAAISGPQVTFAWWRIIAVWRQR